MIMSIKTLIHTANESDYQFFIRNLYEYEDKLELANANIHGNLLDVYYQLRSNIVILPASEYTQEFHDFITEYHKQTKVIIFINTNIKNTQIFQFWKECSVLCVGRREYFGDHYDETNCLAYDSLYDHNTYSYTNQNRNNKIAVLLSQDDTKSAVTIGSLLYPETNEKLVLFNSATYSHPQNVGFLNPADTCVVLNTYKSLIDLDDKFSLEAQICRIPNISTDGDILSNIQNSVTKKLYENIEEYSYDSFIVNHFLPKVIKA
jgi:hypothetical protein